MLPKNGCTAFCRRIGHDQASAIARPNVREIIAILVHRRSREGVQAYLCMSGSVQGGFPVRSLSAKASSGHSLLIDVISLFLQAVTSAKVGSVLAGRHGRTLSVTSSSYPPDHTSERTLQRANHSGSTSTRHNDRHLLYRPRNCASYSSLACGMCVGWCKTKYAQQSLSAHFFAPPSNRASPDSLQHARGCTHFNGFYIECLWMAS